MEISEAWRQSESDCHHITYNCIMRNWSPFKKFTIAHVGFVYDSFLEYSLFLWYTNTAIFGLHCAGWGEVRSKKIVFFRACCKIRLNTHEPTLTKYVNNSLRQSPFWESDRSSARQEISHILWKLMVHFRIHIRRPTVPILRQINPLYFPYPTSWRFILILSPINV